MIRIREKETVDIRSRIEKLLLDPDLKNYVSEFAQLKKIWLRIKKEMSILKKSMNYITQFISRVNH